MIFTALEDIKKGEVAIADMAAATVSKKFEFEKFNEAFGKGTCRVCRTDDDIWETEFGYLCFSCAYEVREGIIKPRWFSKPPTEECKCLCHSERVEVQPEICKHCEPTPKPSRLEEIDINEKYIEMLERKIDELAGALKEIDKHWDKTERKLEDVYHDGYWEFKDIAKDALAKLE